MTQKQDKHLPKKNSKKSTNSTQDRIFTSKKVIIFTCIVLNLFGIQSVYSDSSDLQPNSHSTNHTLGSPANMSPAYTRQPSKEQILESLRKLKAEGKLESETAKMLIKKLMNLYGNNYDVKGETREETKIFLAMQNNAKDINSTTGKDLYYYSLIIREPRVRTQLQLTMSQTQADEWADTLQALAVKKGDLSGLTKTGYDNIVKATGQPIYSKEKIDGYYQAYHNVSLKDPVLFTKGLQQLMQAMKSRCLVDYYPDLDYPFYYFHVYRESGEITMNRNRPIGERLHKFSRLKVRGYPKIEDQLDMIYLRHYLYCYERQYVQNKIAGYLTGQTDNTAYQSYSIPKPVKQSSMRERVVLSILAELIDKPELIPVFSYHLTDVEKTNFKKQRSSLLSQYRDFYGNSVPEDMDIE